MPGLVSTGMSDGFGVQLPVREIYLGLTNHPGQLSLAMLPWVGAMSTGQRKMMFCGWGVKAGLLVFGVKPCIISERFGGLVVATKRYKNPRLLYFT